jgi:signal transduction histidine kinase
VLDDVGLVAALRWYLDREAQRAGLSPKFSAGKLEKHLSPELETACFRIAQEALTNVVRHANASQVWVELSQRGKELRLIVRDDGIGFDAAAMYGSVSRAKLGPVRNARESSDRGGRIEFVCVPGQGTEVHAHFPLSSPAR